MIPPGIPDFFSRRRVLDAGRSRCPGAPGQATPRSRGSRSPSTASGPTRRLPHPSDISPGAAGHLTGTRQRASTNSSAERPTPPERCSPTRRPGTTRGWATTSSSASWSRFPEAKTASRTPAHLSKRRCTRRPRGSSTAPTRRLLGPQPGIRGPGPPASPCADCLDPDHHGPNPGGATMRLALTRARCLRARRGMGGYGELSRTVTTRSGQARAGCCGPRRRSGARVPRHELDARYGGRDHARPALDRGVHQKRFAQKRISTTLASRVATQTEPPAAASARGALGKLTVPVTAGLLVFVIL